jgi:hypothetical protein
MFSWVGWGNQNLFSVFSRLSVSFRGKSIRKSESHHLSAVSDDASTDLP